MRLTGEEFTLLQDALLDAFDTETLRLTLRKTGHRLDDIAPRGTSSSVVLNVIEAAERAEWIHDLVATARIENPRNEKLFTVASALGIDPAPVVVSEERAESALPEVAARLERLVSPSRGIADLGSFAEKIQHFVRTVGAVEIGKASGTGFLIGPQTVLTNYHVVRQVIDGEASASIVRFRTDYRRLRDGMTTNAGTAHELAGDWLVDHEMHSLVDMKAFDPEKHPADHELDYAVLRLKEPIGDQPAPGKAGGKRGWIEPALVAHEFEPDTFLMVVQHPCHDPISFDDADDAIVRVNANGTRVHYRTNTMPGSSGSPCFNRDLELVALHHAGQPGSPDFGLPCHKRVTPADYNAGIPIARIQERLARKDLSWVFGAHGPG